MPSIPKPRIFYCAWTPPSSASGACLAVRRHFIEHNDFEVFVFTNGRFQDEHVQSYIYRRSAWWERVMRTRFRRIFRQLEMLFLGWRMLPIAFKLAREFKPDAIFTIPDNDVSWCAYLLAHRLNIPLVTNFQDWWPHNLYWAESERPFPWIRKFIEWRFRKMYRASALAFCTSEGMKNYLGMHPNAVTLLPCPGLPPQDIVPATLPDGKRPIRLLYAGTIVGDYGRSVLTLAKKLANSSDVEFIVYGPKPDWTEEDIEWATTQGIYRGFIVHNQLRATLASADAFLTVMSFEEQLKIMSSVSFTTKFLEYSQYGRPVIVWGPPYCQPVVVAQKTGAGLPVLSADPEAVVAALKKLTDAHEYKRLTEGAIQAGATFFDPNQIHSIFKNSIYDLLKINS